jgi:hypothetical protein
MSEIPIVIDLTDQQDLQSLITHESDLLRCIEHAVNVLKNYKPCTNLTPKQVKDLLGNIGVNEKHTPGEMNESIINADNAVIMDKKYLNATISRAKFKALLGDLLSVFKEVVPVAVIEAIVGVIKGVSTICCTSDYFNIQYKNLCFKFFTSAPEDEVLVLLVNIHFADVRRSFSCFSGKFRKSKLNLEFFGALVKTSYE